MQYIIVRTYGNGAHMNKVYPILFNWLSQADKVCNYLNQHDTEGTSERWISMPLTEYVGDVW